MTSSTAFSPSPIFLPTDPHCRLRRRGSGFPSFVSQRSVLSALRCSRPGLLRVYASIAERNPDLSWSSADSSPEFNGWAVVEYPVILREKKKGIPAVVVGGIGISLAVVLAAIAQFSLSRKGLKFHISNSLNMWRGPLNRTELGPNLTEDIESGLADFKAIEDMESPESIPEEITSPLMPEASTSNGKLGRIIIPVAVDSTQKESVKLLRSMKIIEEGTKADELCTRREYARWLVQVNLLERNPRHRIVPSISLSGSRTVAFDDVNVEDPDFKYIQALAEAGVIPSKLSTGVSTTHGSETQRRLNFYPESFICRQDLIDWRVQLEYEFFPGLFEKISRTKVGFMDVKDVDSGISPEFFMDLLVGDKSIIRRVFGQSKRFQPNKPSTKAQAAVALTSGRMLEAVQNELSRIEAENSSRMIEMEDIRSELLGRGDIQKFWDEKLKEEETRGSEVQKEYIAAVEDLEKEQALQEKAFQDHLKERAAMDCQRQLIDSLKEEVNEMSERLSSERATFVDEQHNLQVVISDLVMKHEGLLDAKSILEAEKEAIRILRSWVEEEARKSQTRAKVLEEAGRRWKWDNQS